MGYIIKNATLVNEGESFLASVAVSGEFIEKVRMPWTRPGGKVIP